MIDKNCKNPKFKKRFEKEFGKKAFENYSKGLAPNGTVTGTDWTGLLLILPILLSWLAAIIFLPLLGVYFVLKELGF